MGNLRWDCSKGGCYRAHLPDWSMLDGCFPGSTVRPRDVDGEVEQYGHLLRLEQKGLGVPLNRVTIRIARRLADQGHTTLIFWGNSPDGTDIARLSVYRPGAVFTTGPACLADLRAEVSRWWTEVRRG